MRDERADPDAGKVVTRYADAYLASSIGVGEDATLRVGLTPKPSGSGAAEIEVVPQRVSR